VAALTSITSAAPVAHLLAIQSPGLAGAKPWTSALFDDASENFAFAAVTDPPSE